MGYTATFDHNRKFGVEIEVFGVNQYEIHHTMSEQDIQSKIGLFEIPSEQFWYITSDSSIQGEDPTEIKSPILVGMEGLAEVKRVLSLLENLGCQTNASCGFHVHWNVVDYTGKNILALLRLYAKFENVIDGLVNENRRENRNRHCRSLVHDQDIHWINDLDQKQTSRALEIALRFDKNQRVQTIGNMNGCGSRNHKVNIASYLKFGTIEFRHHEGTTDAKEAINWIVFTQQLVNRAKLASVSKEMSAKPILGEMLRVLGMVDYQGCDDPLVLSTREWLKGKRKKRIPERNLENAGPRTIGGFSRV